MNATEIVDQVMQLNENFQDVKRIRFLIYIILLMERIERLNNGAGPSATYWTNEPAQNEEWKEAYELLKKRVNERDLIIREGFIEIRAICNNIKAEIT